MSTETPEQTAVNYHQAKREKLRAAITAWQAADSNAATHPYGDADDLDDALLGHGLQLLPVAASDCRYRVLIDGQAAPYVGQDRPAGPMGADEAAEVFLVAVAHAEDNLAEHAITVRPATDTELVGHAVTGAAHVDEQCCGGGPRDNCPCMHPELAAITPETAAHVLFHLGRGGWPASQFIQHLLRAFEVSDVVNRARLGAGFPAYLAAFELYRSSDTGVAQLQEIAEKDGV